MKKIVSAVLVAICLFLSMPALAENRDLSADTQLMLSIDHFYKGDDTQIYAMATFMYDITYDSPIIFGYVGPMISSGKWNFYPMAVVMDNPVGWSAGPSLWLEYKGKNYLFIEGDYYVPVLSASRDKDAPSPIHSYYGFGEYSRDLNEKWAVGVDWELFGNIEETRMAEMAYGPFVKAGRIKVWCFYDQTPMLPGANLGMRFKFAL
jgi:hypothetical protein